MSHTQGGVGVLNSKGTIRLKKPGDFAERDLCKRGMTRRIDTSKANDRGKEGLENSLAQGG